MSFTTRCPSCGTMFKVVADQLKISEGWVRCGHCADVFDATLNLQPWTPPEADVLPDDASDDASDAADESAPAAPDDGVEEAAEVSGPEPESEPGQRPALAVGPVQAEAPDAEQSLPTPPEDEAPPPAEDVPEDSGWDMMLVDQHALDTLPPPDLPDAPPFEQEEAGESDFQRELERFAAGLGRLNAARAGAILRDAAPVDMTGIPSAPAPDDAEGHGSADDGAATSDVPDDDGEHDEPGFVRQARRQAFWQSTGMRVGMSLLALVLAALLAGQWAVHERDRLAAWRPGWQPLLSKVCEQLGCKLAPLRRIDAIVIDSSTLVRLLGDLYAFDVVLKNTSSTPLAVPALELSLTDGSGAVISRRVFPPEEWPNAPALLSPKGSASVHFRLSLALGDANPMAGYHAVLFYP